jgi:hypothetical protein
MRVQHLYMRLHSPRDGEGSVKNAFVGWAAADDGEYLGKHSSVPIGPFFGEPRNASPLGID